MPYNPSASTGPRSGDRGELGSLVPRALCGRAASTGPRSGDRGEPAAFQPPFIATARLQRGRGPETAESGQSVTRRAPGRRFNGAAVRRPRRGMALPLPRPRVDSASTGPRSGDRGELGIRAGRAGEGDASTGPRSGDRGELMTANAFPADRMSLQRGRGPETAESRRRHPGLGRGSHASTGPRSGDRGELR
jgi:hypothetical protein